MAQATSPSMSLQDGQQNDHQSGNRVKSDPDVPIDPSIAQSSPTYPPPYSPYNPQGHDMSQYQGHPPHQMYATRPDWPQYPGAPHAMQGGPYSSPATTVSSASPAATAGPRPGQVCLYFLILRDGNGLWDGELTQFLCRFIPSFRFRARNSINDHDVGTKKLSACTNVDGRDAKRHMEPSIT